MKEDGEQHEYDIIQKDQRHSQRHEWRHTYANAAPADAE